MIKLTKRQLIILGVLEKLARPSGRITISNSKLAKEVAEQKGITGHSGAPMSNAAISAHLERLEEKEYIKMEYGRFTGDRIIEIVQNVENLKI